MTTHNQAHRSNHLHNMPQGQSRIARRPLVRQVRFALAAMLLGALGAGAAHAARPGDTEQWAKGRILVMPKAGLPDTEFAKILHPHGGKARKVGQSDLYIVDLPANASEKAVVAILSHNPHLKFAELDQRVTPSFIANDPYFGSEWHLSKIEAPAAWDISQGAGITIAILDTGVNGAHPDLAARMVPGWNFYDNNSNTADVQGHGTAVAGTAAASVNNAVGVASVAGQAKIMPVRIADPNAYAYWSTVAQGLTYAADNGARVANISYVGVAGSSSIKSAAQYMKSKGGLVTVSAGNNGIDENVTPTDTMIVVSATDSYDQRTSWSSYGSFVTVSAPGANIWTTNREGGYSAWNGTSFASPIAAGTVASMMAANPAVSNAQIESLLYSTSRDLGTAGRDPYFGYGRLNAALAVQAAARTAVTVDTQAPTAAISAPVAYSTVTGVVPVTVSASDDVGVARVELKVNGTLVATDSTAPFGFSWNSASVPNGMATLVALAYDAAGNVASSASVAVNVANATSTVTKDTTAPTVRIVNPVAGKVNGNVSISTSASDDSAASGITQYLYVDGVLKASGTGTTLSFNWNTRKVSSGTHTIQAVAKDAAGNTSSVSVQVSN